jgi:hypothetical protein
VFQSTITIGDWSAARATDSHLAAALVQAAAPNDVVMSGDSGAYAYLTGHPGVISPNDDLTTIETTARDYNVRWLVLEAGSIVPSLVPVLQDDVRPTWLSSPIAVSTDYVPIGAPPQGALYAVCLAPDDMRCAQ